MSLKNFNANKIRSDNETTYSNLNVNGYSFFNNLSLQAHQPQWGSLACRTRSGPQGSASPPGRSRQCQWSPSESKLLAVVRKVLSARARQGRQAWFARHGPRALVDAKSSWQLAVDDRRAARKPRVGLGLPSRPSKGGWGIAGPTE